MLLEIRFGYRGARGGAVEESGVSGAGTGDLVALETWRSDSEIVNLT